jgi:hypothetical protein
MSELTPERITAFFDRIAAEWDEMRLVYYDEAVIERLAAAAELDETMTVPTSAPAPASSPPASPDWWRG